MESVCEESSALLINGSSDGQSTMDQLYNDYKRQAVVTAAKFRDLIDDRDGWTLLKADHDGVRVESRKSSLSDSPILLTTTNLECGAEKVLAIVLPWLPYRIQWDELLQSLNTIDQISESVYLIQHITKKRLPLSARDSIDVVSVGKNDRYYYVASSGITHPDYPPNEKFVRTYQYIGGYAIYFDEKSNSCQFKMLFHADMNISAPKVVSSIVDWAKPKLMVEKMKMLKKAVKSIDVKEVDLRMLPI